MSASQPPTIQTTFDSTATANQTGISVDITGDVQYPREVAGYQVIEDSYQTVYAAPTGDVISDRTGCIRDEYVLIGIKSVTGGSGYAAKIELGNSSFDGYDDTAVAIGETEVAVARKAVEWMKSHPAPAETGVFRPAFGEGASADRDPMRHQDIADQVERIRVGSTVEIDSLPPVRVTAELDGSELAVATRDVFEAETPNSETIHLILGDSISYSDVLSYSGSVAVNSSRVIARHVTVSNERNLRDSVDTDQYEWLQDRQGETVIKKNTDTTFQVVEVDHLRDGFLNPSRDGELDPQSHRSSGGYIDGTDEWFDNVVGLSEGTYRITKSGIAELSDKYAGHIVVDAQEWNDANLFTPTDTFAVGCVKDAPENVVTDDRDGLSRTDNVTDITGVGSATAEKFWETNVSDLYRQGFPAVQIPAQYHEEAIADMYALPSYPTEADAARAVVGLLGGAAFDNRGERIGSVATMISGQLNPDDMAYGWLAADKSECKIKNDYVPNWLTNGNKNPDAVGAGAISVEDIHNSFDRDIVEPVQATAIRQNLEDDDLAGVMTSEGYVEVEAKPLKVMATVANVDLQKVSESDNEHTISVLHAGGGEGVVVLNNTTEPFTAVIDTESRVDPENLRSDAPDE